MNGKKLIPIVIAIIGLFYVAAPHDVHVSSGLDFGWTHSAHIVLGFVLFVIAGAIYFSGGKRAAKIKARPAVKAKPVAKKKRRK